MPKEQINGLSLPFSEEAGLRSVVEVTWGRDSSVTLVTKCVDASTGEVSTRERLSSPERHAGEGWYLDLDRRGINELIRKLRRARDQAFGRDE